MNASNLGISGSYLFIFASPHCYSTGQARQNTQQITEQHYATMSISPLPAVNMVVLFKLSFYITLIILKGVSLDVTELDNIPR